MAGRQDGTAALAPAPPADEMASASWRALGCDVRLLVTDPAMITRARALLEADLDALDRAASRFRTDSEVADLSAAGGRPSVISAVLADAIAAALAGAELSDGDLDPTVDLAALGYDRTFTELAPAGSARTPTGAANLAPGLRRHVDDGPAVVARPTHDWRDIELHVAHGTVQVPAGLVIDLGATAKARCADLAASRIVGECGCGVLVSLGGDVAVAGPAPVGGWIVRVQDVTGDPTMEPGGGSSCLVAITSGGLATSSTAARRWQHGGSVLHHILDPRTGRPASDVWRTVTVAAPTCLLANIASTTSVIRGRGALAWLAELDVPARLVPNDRFLRDDQAHSPHPPGAVPVLLGGWPQEEAH